MINIRFGVPVHGWLPIEMKAENYVLQIEASNFPINPLDELCSALINIVRDESAVVNWHLEPAWYHFHFETTNKLITLTILESKRYGLKSNAQFSTTGTIESLVLSIGH